MTSRRSAGTRRLSAAGVTWVRAAVISLPDTLLQLSLIQHHHPLVLVALRQGVYRRPLLEMQHRRKVVQIEGQTPLGMGLR